MTAFFSSMLPLLNLSLLCIFVACEKKDANSENDPSELSSSSDGESSDDGGEDDGNDMPPVMDMPTEEECGKMCSLFDQNSCGPDEMCASWFCAPDTNAWDQSICAPTGVIEKGESCMNPWEAERDQTCGRGLTCFGGVCVDTCIGSQDEPECLADGELCVVINDGALAMCLPGCNPLSNTCPDSHPLCIPAEGVKGFLCVAPAMNSQDNGYGKPCMFSNACKPGLICMDAGKVAAPGCEADRCCATVCNTEMGDEQCESDMEQCEVWFDTPIPGYENVGVCVVPE